MEKTKELKKKISLKAKIAIILVISLLSNYFLILSEFTGVVYAASTEWNAKSQIIMPDNNNTDDDKTNSIQDENTVENQENENTVTNQSNTVVEENDSNTVSNQVNNENLQKPSEEGDVNSEGKNNEEEKIVEENLESSLEIADAYKFVNGLVVRGKITLKTTNVKENYASEQVVINSPIIEGYNLKNLYLEKVDLKDSSLTYTSSIENNLILNIERIMDEEQKDQEDDNQIIENIKVLDLEKEITVLYVFEGINNLTPINIGIEETVKYADNEKVLNSNLTKEIEIKEITKNKYEVSAENESMYKGYLYANSITALNYETKYTSIENVEITNLNNIDKIVITEKADNVILKDGTVRNISEYVCYSKTSIDVEMFNNVFGNDGYIEVYTGGRLLGKIDKNTKIENNKYVYTYSETVSNVEFSFKNMINTGKLEILSNKYIRGTSNFTREEVISFGKIETDVVVQEFAEEAEESLKLNEINNKLDINLEDTESKMDLTMSIDTLSTNIDNDVIFTVTLKTSEERYELFKNPVIEIKLPSDVKEIKINSFDILYRNGLSLEDYEVIDGEDGCKVLKIELSGTQIEYTPGLPSNGTTINIFTTIKLDKLTTNKEAKIKFKYTNDIDTRISYELEGKDCVETNVKFVSKYGLLRALDLNNVKTAEEKISYDTEMEQIRLENDVDNQIIKFKGTVVNNFEKTINNVEIVGKIPCKTEDITYENDLGTTFDMTLESQILTSGSVVEVYYSEDPNADKDSSTWTKDITDLSKYKSFKLVFTSPEMKQGEKIEFSFDMKVPDNISFNQKAYSTYKVYYNIETQQLYVSCMSKLATDVKEITIDDIEEEKKQVATLDVKTVVSQCGIELKDTDTIHEREIVDYSVYVKNTSKVEAKNVKIKGSIVNGNLYYKYFFDSDEDDLETMRTYFYYKEDTDGSKGYEELEIEKLAPGETKVFSFKGIAKEITDSEKAELYSKIEISADEIESQEIETFKNEIVSAKLSLKLEWESRELAGYEHAITGNFARYLLCVKNISDQELENQEINFVVPNNFEYNNYKIEGVEDCEIKVTENGENYTITIIDPKIEAGEEKQYCITLFIKEMDTSIASKKVDLFAYADIDNEQIKSNIYNETIYQSKTIIDYDFSCDKDSNSILKNDDLVKYTLNIRNIGSVNTGYLEVIDELPNGLRMQSAKMIKNGKEENIEINNDFRVWFNNYININEEIKIEVVAKVVSEDFLYDQKTVENKMSINGGQYFDLFYTNVISLNIENEKITVDQDDDVGDDNSSELPPPLEEIPDINNDDNQNNNNDDINNNNNGNNANNNNNNNNNNNDSNNNNNNNNNQGNTSNNNNQSNTNNNSNDNTIKTKKTYRVSGKAWLDINKNGIYESTEKMLSGINVIVYKVNNNGKIETNLVVGNAKTSNDGAYEITNIEEGKYVVVFEYDTEMYSPTKYQVSNAKSTENSDAINKVLDETNKKVGMTDILELSNSSIKDIDIGLVLNNEFDLKLEKYITKTIVYNAKGEKEATYGREKLQKVEINSKLFEKSTVDIFYEIIVENEGDISGYVNRIVDYLPDGLIFDETRNPDWFKSEDGMLYYTGLIDKQIRAGESRKIDLVLTYESNTIQAGRILNSAELVETSNEKGLVDIDSVVNNKVSTEDDYGQVELLVTLSTGLVVSNVVMLISIILTLALCIIVVIIITKKINGKIYR